MEDSFRNLISEAKSILILLPTDPVFDNVAAATSLYLAISQENKEVNLYCPTQMIVEFNKLVGVNKIKQELGNKNLSLVFENYNPQGIEKVSWDIDKGQFKLTVVPKVNIAPPTSDQVNISYSGISADLLILIGGSSEADFPAVSSEDLKSAQLAHIGISPLNVSTKPVSSFATAASSISEVVANLIEKTNYQVSEDLATNLLMGIEEATHSFTLESVDVNTFQTVVYLMKSGGKRTKEREQKPSTFPTKFPGMPGNIPSSWTEPKIFKGTSTS